MVMRTDFEVSGHKATKVNYFDRMSDHQQVTGAPHARTRRRNDRPGILWALLGLLCVGVVFGLLALLYAL